MTLLGLRQQAHCQEVVSHLAKPEEGFLGQAVQQGQELANQHWQAVLLEFVGIRVVGCIGLTSGN